MKYFYDTEFIEDGKTIDLISIGVVAEDGREYYAISREFNQGKAKANDWVRKNVLAKLPPRYIYEHTSPNLREQSKAWKSRFTIKEEIIDFIHGPNIELWAHFAAYDHVVLAQLCGTMQNWPPGWPMYTNDIKQFGHMLGVEDIDLPPMPESEHHALADAKWDKVAYEYLKDIYDGKGHYDN